MERALRWARFQPSGVPQKRGLHCACVLCLPCPSGSGSQELDGRTLPGVARLLPSTAPAPVTASAGRVHVPCVYPDPPGGCRPSRISGSLWFETGGLFAVWWGVPSLGWSLPLSPLPCVLPPAGLGWPVSSPLTLLWTCSDPLFCKRLAVYSGRLIFSLSFAVPQFKLVTHKSSL